MPACHVAAPARRACCALGPAQDPNSVAPVPRYSQKIRKLLVRYSYLLVFLLVRGRGGTTRTRPWTGMGNGHGTYPSATRTCLCPCVRRVFLPAYVPLPVRRPSPHVDGRPFVRAWASGRRSPN